MDKTKFNFQINGLRGILCLLIVFYHFFIRHSAIELSQFIPNANVVWGGFFVLSGFFLKFKDSKSYWLPKICKTYFPYLISVLIIALITGLFGTGISILDFAMNIICLPMLSTFFSYADGAHWYIVYLIWFYLFYYLLNVFSKLIKKDYAVNVGMLLFGCLSMMSMFLPDGGNFIVKTFRILFNSRFVFLIFGYFLSLAFKSKRKIHYVLAAVTMLMCEIYLCFESFWINSLYFVLLIIAVILCLNDKAKFLEIKPLQILGCYSLYIYLIHQNIGYMIIDLFNNYWLGATIASFIMIAVGIAFGIGYNYLLNLIKNSFEKRKNLQK